ncbi:MAG: hypothetical protein IJN79_06060 [Clostridia bacterium]|nr:hypothetical protein [Clostridia bacterium]
MKTELILTRVNEISAHLKDGALDFTGQTALRTLISDLAEQVRMETAASNGAGNAAKTISAMLKRIRKDQEGRTALHYAWIDAKGRQCVCDSYRAFRLTEHLPLEDRPADAGDPIDLDKIVPVITPEQYYALPLPSVGELKAHIALERAGKVRGDTILWYFGDDAPTVDAMYLMDVLAVLPDAAEVYVQRGEAGIRSPMLIKGIRGEAILLPVRCKRYGEKCAAAAKREAETNAAEVAQREDEKRQRNLLTLLQCYNDEVERNPEYALTPDEFANIAQYAYQPAV